MGTKRFVLFLAVLVFAFGIPEVSEARTVYGDLEVVTDKKKNILLLEGDTITIADGTDTVVISRSDTYFDFGGAPFKGVDWENSLLPRLDADLLDGIEGDSFLRSDTIDTYQANKLNLNNTEIDGVDWSNSTSGDGSGLNADLLDDKQDTQFMRSDVSDTFNSPRISFGDNRIVRVGSTYCSDTKWIGGDGGCYEAGDVSGASDGYLPDDPAPSNVDMKTHDIIGVNQVKNDSESIVFGRIDAGGSPTRYRGGIKQLSGSWPVWFMSDNKRFNFSYDHNNTANGWLEAGRYDANERIVLGPLGDFNDPSKPIFRFNDASYDEQLGFIVENGDVKYVGRASTSSGADSEIVNLTNLKKNYSGNSSNPDIHIGNNSSGFYVENGNPHAVNNSGEKQDLTKQIDSSSLPLTEISDGDTVSISRRVRSNRTTNFERLGIQTKLGDTVAGLKAEIVDDTGNVIVSGDTQSVIVSGSLSGGNDYTFRINNDSGSKQEATAFLEMYHVKN